MGAMFGTVLCRHLLNNIPPVFFLTLPQTSIPALDSANLQKVYSLGYAFAYNMIFEWLGLFPLIVAVLVIGEWILWKFLRKAVVNPVEKKG